MKTHIVMNFGWALYSKQYVAVFTNPQMVAPCIFGVLGQLFPSILVTHK